MRRRSSVLFGLGLALLVVPLPSAAAADDERAASAVGQGRREAHDPIAILSDDDFELPTSGVRSGSGTESDPYLIEGWEIDWDRRPPLVFGKAPIHIEGTTAFFEIRDCLLMGGTDEPVLVILRSVRHGVVRDSVFAEGRRGIDIVASTDIRILDNNIGGDPWEGVFARHSSDLEIRGNEFRLANIYMSAAVEISANNGTISVSDSRQVIVADNGPILPQESRYPRLQGSIYGYMMSDSAVVRNQVENGDILVTGEDVVVADNVARNPFESVLRIEGARMTITGNHMWSDQEAGMDLDVDDSRIAGNLVEGEYGDIQLRGSGNSVVDNKVMTGGRILVSGGPNHVGENIVLTGIIDEAGASLPWAPVPLVVASVGIAMALRRRGYL